MTETEFQVESRLSTSNTLANYLTHFEARSEQAARQNLETAMAGTGIEVYTEPEIRAMVKLEQLKLIGDLSLAEVLLRGKIIKEVEEEALWSIHPNRYANMQEAAQAQGISTSEYSNIRYLYNTVFPYLTNTLGMNLALAWEEVGKSNFRELCPYLVRAITGEVSASRHVESAYGLLMEELQAANTESGVVMTEETVRRTAIEQLMQAGHLPNRQLRAQIRPERPSSFSAHVVDYSHNGRPIKVVITLVNDDQYAVLQRRLGSYINLIPSRMNDLARTQFGQMIIESA